MPVMQVTSNLTRRKMEWYVLKETTPLNHHCNVHYHWECVSGHPIYIVVLACFHPIMVRYLVGAMDRLAIG